ncbi:MAG: hypothetical protein A2X32_04740 [Elusimicrobia bacterium GWC2_64_44]|nr:MAG: hypothetical protein A2X32_04740 [Elusimicrobia bacterium GWC2_64_44]
MKKLTILALLAALPAGAHAMGMGGGWHGGMYGGMRPPHPMGLHLALMLYALMAALGYWVLRHAAAETEKSVRVAGKTVAWFLLVFGLAGMLCALGSHIKSNCGCNKKCGWQEAQGAEASGPAAPAAVNVQVKVEKPLKK